MRKLWLAFLLASIFVLTAAFQQTEIRVEVEAVNLFVTVTDKDGHFITDLDRDRFEVYEDGKLQVITNFLRESNVPLRLGLLIDTSASVRLKLDFEKRAAINFIRSVMRRNDRMLLVEFDEGVSLRHDFTGKPTAIIKEIERLRAGGGTAIWDAIYLTSTEKMIERDARKSIIIVSDGRDLNSRRSVKEAIEMTQASEVTVYAIGTSRFGATQERKGEKTLENLASETGGRAFFPYSAELLESAFDQINKELRSQYSLTYTPKNKRTDGNFRKIKVKIKDGKNYRLRHRKGYYAPEKSVKKKESDSKDSQNQ